MRALYNPTFSERGVLLCAARKPRAKDPLDFEVKCLSTCIRVHLTGSLRTALLVLQTRIVRW